MGEVLNANCSICGNNSGYDKESLESSTWNINGQNIVMCCPCEDELRIKLLQFISSDAVETTANKHNLSFNVLDEILTTLRKELLKQANGEEEDDTTQ